MAGGSPEQPSCRARRDRRDEAERFLRACQAEFGTTSEQRVEEIGRLVDTTGSYAHTLEELSHGARVAWRNALDCLGRAHWRKLTILDARDARTPDDMFEACLRHLETATNGGNIQPAITVFPPQRDGKRGFRIWNSQLIRYAGHRQEDGSVVGDRGTVDETDFAKSLGWRGTEGPFDVLPLVLQTPDSPVRWYEIPRLLVPEVAITHPDHPALDELNLRWYTHPAISNLRMQVGGLSYTAAPFSGWYTVPEIAVRDFGDVGRYNLLPRVAEVLGLDTRSNRSLWKDRTIVELMAAVLHSFDRAKVTIVDHHFAAASFARHEDRERRQGRAVHGRWNRLIPASAPSTTTLFHRTYSTEIALPNFFPQSVVPEGSVC